MIKTDWTPCPWEWDAGDNSGPENHHRYCHVFANDGDLIIADVNDLFDPIAGHANARLIAAAPDLAKAAEPFAAWADELAELGDHWLVTGGNAPVTVGQIRALAAAYRKACGDSS